MPSTRDISKKSAGYRERIKQWQKIRDVMEGEDQVKLRRDVHLSRPKAQDLADYNAYVERACFYAVADRTALGLVGLVFRVSPTIQAPEVLDYLEQSATPEGYPLDTLLRTATREVLSLGRFGLLVDVGLDPVNLTDTRPFIASYQAENIWRWDEVLDPDKGERVLIRVIVEEDPADNEGEEVIYLRELYLDFEVDEDGRPTGNRVYRQQLWKHERSNEQTLPGGERGRATSFVNAEAALEYDFQPEGDPITPTMAGATLDRIPFWFINTYNMLPRPEKPPMLDLANMNVAHWRNSADYEHLLHLVGSPTPWIAANWDTGTPKPQAIGAGAFWELPAGATAGILEFTGASAEALEKAMKAKEDRMAALGAHLITSHERSNTTAETERMQTLGETSVLLSAVQNVQTAFTVALRFVARWAGAGENEVEDTKVEMNRDFVETKMSPEEQRQLVASWQAGAFSRQTLHENLQRGEIIDPKRTLDEELELIEQEALDEPAALRPPAPAQETVPPEDEGEEGPEDAVEGDEE